MISRELFSNVAGTVVELLTVCENLLCSTCKCKGIFIVKFGILLKFFQIKD